jgi:hypothetical protein
MRSLPDLPCLSAWVLVAMIASQDMTKTYLLGLEVVFDQLLSAVKTAETVDSVLILLADFLLLAHRLLLLP